MRRIGVFGVAVARAGTVGHAPSTPLRPSLRPWSIELAIPGRNAIPYRDVE